MSGLAVRVTEPVVAPLQKTLVAMPLSLLVAVAEVSLYARHWDNVQKKKGAGSQR